VQVRVTGLDDLGGGKFRLHLDWVVARPVPAGYVPFLHFVDEKQTTGEGIAFQAGLDLDPQHLQAAGAYHSTATVTLPAEAAPGTVYAIRVGLYSPTHGGDRLPLTGPTDSGGRARLGHIAVGDGRAAIWKPEPPTSDAVIQAARVNTENRPVDFGYAITPGAFRLKHVGANWELIPLPDSGAFSVQLRLDRLNAAGRRVRSVIPIMSDGAAGAAVPFRQAGSTVSFNTAEGVFAYRIRVE